MQSEQSTGFHSAGEKKYIHTWTDAILLPEIEVKNIHFSFAYIHLKFQSRHLERREN